MVPRHHPNKYCIALIKKKKKKNEALSFPSTICLLKLALSSLKPNNNMDSPIHNGSTAPQPPKRRRPTKSCENCRRRKLRCDRGFPCNQCSRARTALHCSFVSDGLSEEGDSRAVPRAVAGRDGSPAPTAQSRSANGMPPSAPPPEPRLHDKENEVIRNLRQRVRTLESELSHSSHSPVPPVGPNNYTTSDAGASGWAIPATPSRLRVTTEKTKLFGSSHWLHTAEKVFALIFSLTV